MRYAARRAGLDQCTPNDLRRTYSTWLRAAGANLDTIAPTMGHKDTRMLQRTYARLPKELLAARLAAEMGLDTGWTDKSGSAATGETGETAAQSGMVPRGGIEPPTRGFSVPFLPSQAALLPLGTSVKRVRRSAKAAELRHNQAQSLLPRRAELLPQPIEPRQGLVELKCRGAGAEHSREFAAKTRFEGSPSPTGHTERRRLFAQRTFI